jgi:hypothetical protein
LSKASGDSQGAQNVQNHRLQELAIRSGRQPLQTGAWPARDAALYARFSSAAALAEESYLFAFRYLLTGFLEWRSADGARAFYPGVGSCHGRDVDAIEGFARFAPAAAAWLASGRSPEVQTLDGTTVDLARLLREGMVAGSDPGAPGYWGDCQPKDQRVCEAADIALALWLSRDHVWSSLDEASRDRLVSWLSGAAEQPVYDNNWHLFPLLVLEALNALAPDPRRDRGRWHYERIKTMHRGQGWFADGKDWRIDYYNAWGIHYALYWLGEITPVPFRDRPDRALQAFVRTYRYLMSPRGLPMIGRSIPYRLAAPVPLIAAQHRHPDVISPGLARRALAAVWGHFVPRGAIRAGLVTQGYEGAELAVLDRYSGPASPLWGLRSLVLALLEPSGSPFWNAPPDPLPVEHGDYHIEIPPVGWTIEGRCDSGEIVIRRKGKVEAAPFLALPAERLLQGLDGPEPDRPENLRARYFRSEYSSARPFWRANR